MLTWMLYGAYGATGRLILDEAQRRGHRPILAARNAAKLQQLQRVTGLDTAHLPLERGAELRAALSGLRCVVLAAGPYEVTGPPMRAACLDARCSYLDINGELEDFRQALACDESSRAAAVAVIPGAGYGVVFAECLAAQITRRMPDTTSLRLSLATQIEGRSRGATLSTAMALARSGAEVRNGELRSRPMHFQPGLCGLRIERASDTPPCRVPNSWRCTAPPSFRTSSPASRCRAASAFVRVAGPWIGRVLARAAARRSDEARPRPPDAAIAALRSRVWAEASNDQGLQQ